MLPSNSQILKIVNNSISPEDIRRSFIYWYRKLLKQGEDIRIGLQTVLMPFEGTFKD